MEQTVIRNLSNEERRTRELALEAAVRTHGNTYDQEAVASAAARYYSFLTGATGR